MTHAIRYCSLPTSRKIAAQLLAIPMAIMALATICSNAFSQSAASETPPAPAATAPAPQSKPVFVAMTTSKGIIYLELNSAKAPVTVENFVGYVNDGFYNGTTFHRVIKTFMIQGGGFTPDMQQKQTKAPIVNEWKNGLPNVRGSISMARTNAPDSATSQFFINTVDNKMLDMPRGGAAYAVFGKVIKGMEVVDAIAAVKTGQSHGMGDVPVDTVTIEKVEVIANPPAPDAPVAPAAPAAPTAPSAPAKTP